MSPANESPSPGAVINTPDRDRDRDHAADSDDSLARKRQRLSEEPEVRIEADEPEDMGDDLHHEDEAYSCTFQIGRTNLNVSVIEELKQLQQLVAGDCMYRPILLILMRHVLCHIRVLDIC
jgi:hypothetical protein